MDRDYKFSESGIYCFPEAQNYTNYKEYIKRLPMYDMPELFGLNNNA